MYLISHSSKVSAAISCVLFIVAASLGCSAQQTPQQALESMRQMTREGKLPPEAVVEAIERRFSGTETGALARLLRARIRFENKDFRGAADLLDSDIFARLTRLGDYALWLRGRALKEAGEHRLATAAFESLLADHPGSLRSADTRLRWAESAIASGRAGEVKGHLAEMNNANSPEALLLTAKAFESEGNQADAIGYFRKAFFYGGAGTAGTEAESKLKALGVDTTSANAEELKARAQRLLATGNAAGAFDAYSLLLERFPGSASPDVHLGRLSAAAKAGDHAKALTAFSAMPTAMAGRDQAYRDLIGTFAKAKLWPQARSAAEEMRQRHPQSPNTVKAWVDAGYAARDAKNKTEEGFFLRGALIAWPNAVEVAGAQFELAWLEHEAGNSSRAADMLIEHLARYADRDTANRGRAGYWSARNAEKAGRTSDACALYDALVYRYSANWYGHLGFERLTSMRSRGLCGSAPAFPSGSLVPRAAANLKTVTVAPETAGPKEIELAEKGEQLSTIGLFDWAIDEMKEAQKTARNSPRINLSLAKHYRLKGDNVNALLSLAKSYPDYSQMFPEEMGREEWDIFYPHVAWDQITAWARQRDLDHYQVAGLIRQESVFNPTARSSANAYGLMQLLLPTARMMARKHGVSAPLASHTELFEPALNIELGTAYMREQLDKYGRVEYMAVAYNAGPNRVEQWRRTLPLEIDAFVEAIPFRETRGYVQGIIRNTAQYRRLYDENGNFKPNVGTRPLRAAIDSKPAAEFASEFPEVRIGNSYGE